LAEIEVLVTGAAGRMGRTVMAAVLEAEDMSLAGGVDPGAAGRPLPELAEGAPERPVAGDLSAEIAAVQPEVMVDFTAPAAVMGNLRTALGARVACVVGTTGLSESDLEEVRRLCEDHDTPAIIAPNFSIGANLMMRFAEEAASAMHYAEIIERHHENKRDAPSGTAMMTAERMSAARGRAFEQVPTEHLSLEEVRGGETAGIRVHAVRMPGVVANQEVFFGGPGETLKIEHVTTGRECFVPGVLLAIRRIGELSGLVYGLQSLLQGG
jgi:4-hydroxy-tetrahydrodipicolinate reductase